jgi:hypothetical protein
MKNLTPNPACPLRQAQFVLASIIAWAVYTSYVRHGSAKSWRGLHPKKGSFS